MLFGIWTIQFGMGTLLEDDKVEIVQEAVAVIKTLDSRGILQSIASKNNLDDCKKLLMDFGIWGIFLYPQINWNEKSQSVKLIAKDLNLNLANFAFVDDQEFERNEVEFNIPEVLCIDAKEIINIPDMPCMNPHFITNDSKNRRMMYMNDAVRKSEEEKFSGSKEDFLASLNMVLSLSYVQDADLQRVEELTVRTHQLNSTGYTYSYDELEKMSHLKDYKIIIAGLDDKYGSYGKIGLCLIKCNGDEWILKLLLMSCRVMSRGVGTVLLNYVLSMAKEKSARIKAEFLPTDRNKLMYITYKFAGFKEIEKQSDGLIVLGNDLENIQPCPYYITLKENL